MMVFQDAGDASSITEETTRRAGCNKNPQSRMGSPVRWTGAGAGHLCNDNDRIGRGSGCPAVLSFMTGALMGALVFILLYGTRILDVTYTDWLLTQWYDLSQHHVGWELYRASGWHFPIGLCDNSLYPYMASVVYSDSIPLLSLVFKLLSPILPEKFQFFGWYGLFCFAMQGGCAKLLVRRFISDEWLRNVAALPFIFCMPFIDRMYYHTALASHYLILMAMILFVYRDRLKRLWAGAVLWCLLGSVCVSIHVTIYAMIGIMTVGFALCEALEKGAGFTDSLKHIVMVTVLFLLASMTVFYVFGGAYGGVTGSSFGLGKYSANLNALFNSQDFSWIVPALGSRDGQDEGFAYVGIAALVLFLPAVTAFVRGFALRDRAGHALTITALLMSAVCIFIALSPVVTLGDRILFELKVPSVMHDLWSVFRASGRFMWPVMYLFILFSLVWSKKALKSMYAPVLTVLCLVQIVEFWNEYTWITEEFSEEREAGFTADEFRDTDLSGIRHIQFMYPYSFGEYYDDEVRDTMIGYTELALDYGMTVSNFHFSRDYGTLPDEQIEKSRSELESGKARRDTMYVFPADEYEDIYNPGGLLEETDTGTEIVLMVAR